MWPRSADYGGVTQITIKGALLTASHAASLVRAINPCNSIDILRGAGHARRIGSVLKKCMRPNFLAYLSLYKLIAPYSRNNKFQFPESNAHESCQSSL
jgi:hypothetical protein